MNHRKFEMLEKLAKEEMEDRYSWKDAQRWADWKAEPTWDRNGLEMIAEEAIRFFQYETGVNLPYNLSVHGPYVSFPHKKKQREGRDEMVSEVARFCGWIRTAVQFPMLVKLVKKTTSSNGVNSPYTTTDLWAVTRHWQSPGAASRFLGKVRWRANQILRPYGLSVSWKALGEILEKDSHHRVGKAAHKAAGETVRQFLSYPVRVDWEGTSAREVLIRARGLQDFIVVPKAVQGWAAERVGAGEFSCLREAVASADQLVPDETDGVRLLLDPETEETKLGISTTAGWLENGDFHWLIRAGERTFHAPNYWGGRKVAVKNAITAWHQRARLERKEEKLLQKLHPENSCLLVYVQDSYAAGNCRPGTESFASSHGFARRPFVGAHELIPFIGNEFVKRTLQVAVERSAT